ncbi:hypothetical protein J7M22_16100 [Candidatus Poribacteria bacterium]|nr:hypothetical protein [Candidatus Poribacteria bacterium]
MRQAVLAFFILLVIFPYAHGASLILRPVGSDLKEVSLNLGERLDVEVVIDVGDAQVNGVSVYLSFDPRYLKVINPDQPFKPGDFMSMGATEIENKLSADGKLNYTKVTLFKPDSGKGVICSLSFEAISPIAETSIRVDLEDGPRRSMYSAPQEARIFDEAENLMIHIPGIPRWDVNRDGAVDIFDLVLVAKNFGRPSADYDLNGDGIVNIFDLVTIGRRFGEKYIR